MKTPTPPISRRDALGRLALGAGVGAGLLLAPSRGYGQTSVGRLRSCIDRGLKWVARTQSKLGHWTASNYPTAMTALRHGTSNCRNSAMTSGPTTIPDDPPKECMENAFPSLFSLTETEMME